MSEIPKCRDCGREFPHLPAHWHRRALTHGMVCGPCSTTPKCRAPEPCPTRDMCSDFGECCWPKEAA